MKNLPVFENEDFKTSSICIRYPYCVAVAHKDGTIAVKDTKNPNQIPLYFNKDEWSAFIAGVKKGEFDY